MTNFYSISALTSQKEPAKEGMRHLGDPEYFGNVLLIFEILGALVLIIPKALRRIKEWAYAGLCFGQKIIWCTF